MRRRGAASAPAIRMARVLLPRSRKPVSLLISLAGALFGIALTASPAMAFSLNPDAASPGVKDANTLHWILFVVIVVVIASAVLCRQLPYLRHAASHLSFPPGRLAVAGR